MNNPYRMIISPVSMDFRNLDKIQAKEYFNWFLEQIPIRIKILEEFIKIDNHFFMWDANYSIKSLARLGEWFVPKVSSRKMSQQEIKTIYDNSPEWFKWVEIPDYDLSSLTISLSIDIAMYFSQVLVKNETDLKWVLVTKPKNNANYNQPVLMGNSKMECNPVNLIKTYAYGIVRNSKDKKDLIRLYEIWSKLLFEK